MGDFVEIWDDLHFSEYSGDVFVRNMMIDLVVALCCGFTLRCRLPLRPAKVS